MRKIYSVSIGWFAVGMAMLTAFGASALTLLMLRWPVVGGFALAGIVSALAWLAIYRIVTSAARPERPARDAAATVDGVPVQNVEVMQ